MQDLQLDTDDPMASRTRWLHLVRVESARAVLSVREALLSNLALTLVFGWLAGCRLCNACGLHFLKVVQREQTFEYPEPRQRLPIDALLNQ